MYTLRFVNNEHPTFFYKEYLAGEAVLKANSYGRKYEVNKVDINSDKIIKKFKRYEVYADGKVYSKEKRGFYLPVFMSLHDNFAILTFSNGETITINNRI